MRRSNTRSDHLGDSRVAVALLEQLAPVLGAIDRLVVVLEHGVDPLGQAHGSVVDLEPSLATS